MLVLHLFGYICISIPHSLMLADIASSYRHSNATSCLPPCQTAKAEMRTKMTGRAVHNNYVVMACVCGLLGAVAVVAVTRQLCPVLAGCNIDPLATA